MTLNVDFDAVEGEPSPELIERVKSILSRQGLASEHLLSNAAMSKVFEEYRIDSFPTIMLFKNGELVRLVEGEFDFDVDVVGAIQRMVQ